MKRLLLTCLTLLMLADYGAAQCAIGVAPNSGSCSATTYAISTIQTFQPTCSGPLRNVVVSSVSGYADDLRNTGYYVVARIKSATGTLLATSPQTDQYYPGATVTFDFSGANISLAASTTYQLEFYETSGTTQLILFCRSSSSVYASGNLIQDGVISSNYDIYGWTVNVAGGVTAASSNATLTPATSSTSVFYSSSSEAIAKLQTGSTALGSTTAKVTVQNTAPVYNSQLYVRRYYDVTPTSNKNTATATLTLYFSQADFDDYNTYRGSLPALPTGPSDATGISKLRITQQHGTSATGAPGSYSGWAGSGTANVLKTPTSVTCNSTASRWEVVISVAGFSGFFAHTTSTSTPLPLTLINITAQAEGACNHIYWQTAARSNEAGYEIECSPNGLDFSRIGSITGKGIASAYSFYDEAPLRGLNYYRLRSLNQSGEAAYSGIVSAGHRSGASALLSAYPTPASNELRIDAANGTDGAAIALRNMSGKTVTSATMYGGTAVIDVRPLPAGIYLAVYQDGERTETLRVVKQ